MKMNNKFITGLFMACAVGLASCSNDDDVTNPDNNESDIEVVGENEYIVTVQTNVSGSSRTINKTNQFTATVDASTIYIHSVSDSNKVVTLPISSQTISYRVQINSDGSFGLSADTESDDPTYTDFDADENVYFSTWESQTWSNDISGEAYVNSSTEVSYMTYNEDKNKEIYRSASDYDGDGLTSLSTLTMQRIVCGVHYNIMFTDYIYSYIDEAYVYSLPTEELDSLQEKYNISVDNIGIKLYIGAFPSKYNLSNQEEGTSAYYLNESDKLSKISLYESYENLVDSIKVSIGYGIANETNTSNFICTPVSNTTSIGSYVVISYNGMNYTFAYDNKTYDVSANTTNSVTVIYNIEELFQVLSSSDEATTSSRASGDGFKTLDLKPIKVIYGN